MVLCYRGVSGYCIAVLHPRRLSVYMLSSTAGAVAHGAQYKLQHFYSHNLQRTAYNMCHGPFGQILGNVHLKLYFRNTHTFGRAL